MTTEKASFDKLSFEFEHLQRQHEKLLIEIQALKATAPTSPWEGRVTRLIPIVSTLIGMAGLWFGVVQYTVAETASNQMRKRELELTIFKERKEAYLDLMNAATNIAACADREEVKKKAPEYLSLYLGRVHVIADGTSDVFKKKIAFKDKLLDYLKDDKITETPFSYFTDAAIDLTAACKPYVDPRTFEENLKKP